MAGGYDEQSADSRPVAAFDGLASGRTGLSNRPMSAASSSSAFGWQDDAEHSLPGLQAEEHLPWLYAEDDADPAGLDPARVWGVVLTGFAVLALIVGGVWWTTHHRDTGAQLADGSLITAPPGPIKEAPQDPGGKTFDGTGDSSFAVSQGHAPGATLAAGSDRADDVAHPTAIDTSQNGPAAASGAAGGVGVQVGAFSTALAAEAAWAHLAQAYDALSGVSHRIVDSKADIGTVYGLQAVAGSAAAANALCDRLKAAGLTCQVKD